MSPPDEDGIDQHQIGTAAGDVGEGVLGRRAAADHLMDIVPGGQRLQRLVEQRLRIRKQHRYHGQPVFQANAGELSGCLLWPIGTPQAYYRRSNFPYESRRLLESSELDLSPYMASPRSPRANDAHGKRRKKASLMQTCHPSQFFGWQADPSAVR